VFHAPYPYPFKDAISGIDAETSTNQCLTYIEETLFQQIAPAETIAAFVVEAIQGEGGYIVPPDSFLLGLQAIARKHGILVMCDEVQSGVGRTGKFWACQHVEGFEPDVILSAKGLASGLPLCAVIARGGEMNWQAGSHASTFGGNPLACASALATIELVEQSLAENASIIGEMVLKPALEALQQAFPHHIGDVRGRGLMFAIELVENGTEPSSSKQEKVLQGLFEAGIVAVGCGCNSIRFCPPLVVEAHHCEQMITNLCTVLKSLNC
jgi:4-aminobutyrate aminotransferase